MKIKKISTLILNFSLLLSINTESGMQIDDGCTYKLCKKHNYCCKSGINKIFRWVEILRFFMIDEFNKTRSP
jgi:hypothetical protein